MKTLHIDIETFSSVDLSDCGVYRYSEDASFEVLLFAYSIDGRPVEVADLLAGEILPTAVIQAITDNSVLKYAHNAAFERVCLSRLFAQEGTYLDPTSWRCTAVLSAYNGYPFSLDQISEALNLTKKKLKNGAALIRRFCCPVKPTKANGMKTRMPRHTVSS